MIGTRRNGLVTFGLSVAVLCSAGCVVTHPLSDFPTPAASRPATKPTIQPVATSLPPLLLHLPGIGGTRTIDTAMVRGLVAGGFKGEVQIYDWTGGDDGINALRNMPRNRREAARIAEYLVDRHRRDPNAALYLTCHSGGAGLAVWTLEDLPPDVRVQTLVLMSPALSPSYDLTRALRHVIGKAYVFSSPSDNLILGYGTRVFGTIDGVKSDAAGRVGFTRPPQADAGQYAKLVPMVYRPDWIRFHNIGDHIGGMTRLFSRQVILPLVFFGTLPDPVPSPVPLQPTSRPDRATP